MKLLSATLLTLFILAPPVKFPASAAPVTLRDGACAVEIDPSTLAVKMKQPGGPWAAVSAATIPASAVAGLTVTRTRANWNYPERGAGVDFSLNGDELRIGVEAAQPGDFTFPVFSPNAGFEGWILPLFEGVYAPAGGRRWEDFLVKQSPMNTTADFTLPFLGLDFGKFTLTCIFTNPFNNAVTFAPGADGQLEARFTHQFTRKHARKRYGFVVRFGPASPVAPAAIYRRWLQDRGEFVTLREKIQRTPGAARLLGAAHIYLWGSGELCDADVKNWKKFGAELDQSGGEKSRRIPGLLNSDAQAAAKELPREDWPDNYTKRRIIAGLNELFARHEITTADLMAAFPGDFISPADWGNGISPAMIHQLAAAGFDRLWLGCDNWDALINKPETVAAAKKAGYLIGPYDSYDSVHSPDDTDTWETAQFDRNLYQTGAIVNAGGSKRRGFKRKGFRLSPAAARPYVERRVTRLMKAFHANSWFVDCDGFGDYFDDYSPLHPATQEEDMQARIARMKWIRDTFGLVIGTEGCSAGVASTIDFAHGVMTPVIGWGDPDLTNSKSPYFAGNYYPPDEPGIFFMPAKVKEEYRRIYFEPRFRLPLFQTVFHDSVIATHHWTEPSFKSKNLEKTVELLELLYNIPPLYHLNIDEFQKRREQMQRHYRFFSPLHRELALLPMTDFQWLTPDRAVQRTCFGNKVDMVANFSSSEFRFDGTAVPPRGILARWRNGGKTELYIP